jgi:SAM-dependent methyltransferase
VSPLREAEIRPKELFDEYLALCRRDIERFYGDDRKFMAVRCPACDSDAVTEGGFTKLGFRYRECAGCRSLYVSPRPTPAMQEAFARQSEATTFWGTHFYRETAAARREKMFHPRANLVADLVRNGVVTRTKTFADVGAGYGIFLEEVAALGLFDEVAGIEPAPPLAKVCREKGFCVIEAMMEDVGERIAADLLTAFEVLEHVFDPAAFLRACAVGLHEEGALLFTTLTIDGFDLQVLWNESKSIYPPQHINLMSIDGLRTLAERSGLEILSIATPGQLDVDIVANAVTENPSLAVPRFVTRVLTLDSSARAEFQSFLARANLSSHVRVVARRSKAHP